MKLNAHGAVVLVNDVSHTLGLLYWQEGSWQDLPLQADGHQQFRGDHNGLSASLTIHPQNDFWTFQLRFNSDVPTRIGLRLNTEGPQSPFHLIPCCVFGDNNLGGAEKDHFPNLTAETDGISCADYWEFRADRASHPISCLWFEGGLLALAIDPYSDGDSESTTSTEGFVRNGLFSQIGTASAACGVSLGYRNEPRSFVNKDQWELPTEHLCTDGHCEGRIYVQKSASRTDIHSLIRNEYGWIRETPQPSLSREQAVQDLTDAFLSINWQPDKEHFSNMACRDAAKKTLTAWRTLPEVGWSGGAVIAYPLLAAGHRLGNKLAIERASYAYDWVARAYNPDSGLLWDVCGKHEGKQVDWWWSGYLVSGVHCAYTNGSAVYYLLKGYRLAKAQLGVAREEWLQTALQVLDTVVTLQLPSGNFGYTYAVDRKAIVDAEGFAGVWFVPALVLAYQLTQQTAYLDAAEKGLHFYGESVRNLACCGSPMDTWKCPEQEGNLGFIRGAQLLYEVTQDETILDMYQLGAEYEYLWRYAFKARPQYPPLKGADWNSCGGSVTSVSNPHIHPMGIFVSKELRRLAELSGDSYHLDRSEDGLNWAVNSVALYPDTAGYGATGVLTERYCPSDGLNIETFPDGTPSSIWFSYNGWAAAAVLEGLVESMDHG